MQAQPPSRTAAVPTFGIGSFGGGQGAFEHAWKAVRSATCGPLLITLALVPSAPAQVDLNPVPTYETAVVFDLGGDPEHAYLMPYGLAAGELSDNPPGGYPEVAVACGTVDVYVDGGWTGADGKIRIFRNTGDWSDPQNGFVQLGSDISFPFTAPAEVELADMDNDGDLDLVVSLASLGPSEQDVIQGVAVLRNTGNASLPAFPNVTYYTTDGFGVEGFPCRGLVVADLDADGYKDVAAASDLWSDAPSGVLKDRVYVWRNQGDGTLEFKGPRSLGLIGASPAADLVVGDFDRSGVSAGKPDLATANIDTDVRSVLRNDGNFTLSSVTSNNCDGNGLYTIATGRFNNSTQRDDIAGSIGALRYTLIYHSDNAGGFTHDCDCDEDGDGNYCEAGEVCDRYPPLLDPPPLVTTYTGTAVGHLNGSNRLDVVTTGDGPYVQQILGRGNGTFKYVCGNSAYTLSITPAQGKAFLPVQALIVDLDQDGFGDIVTANHYSDNISVLINKLVIGAP